MFHRKQKGMAALLTVMLVLGVVTMSTLYTAGVISTDQKIYGNAQDQASAVQAAQAGFDYALGFLNSNTPLVTAGLASCAAAGITYTVPSFGVSPLSDGSTFTMTLRCQVASNVGMLTLTSTGTSSDGMSTRIISATVRAPTSSGMTPIVAGNSISFIGNGASNNAITNLMPNAQYSLHAGGLIMNGGTRPAFLIPPAVFPFDPVLSGQTPATFVSNYIGQPIAFYAAQPAGIPYVKLTCSGAKTFTATSLLSQCTINQNTTGATRLNGINGAVIYIAMNGSGAPAALAINATAVGAATDGNFTLGLPGSSATRDILVVSNASQVTLGASLGRLLTVNGNVYTDSPLSLNNSSNSSTLTLNGLGFSSANLLVNNGSGTLVVNGALVSATGVSATVGAGGVQVNYNPATATNLSGTLGGFIGPASVNPGGVGAYGVVAGSWRDF